MCAYCILYTVYCILYTKLYYTILCHAILCHPMPSYAMLCHPMLCYAILCYAILCCAILYYNYYTLLYFTILYYTIVYILFVHVTIYIVYLFHDFEDPKEPTIPILRQVKVKHQVSSSDDPGLALLGWNPKPTVYLGHGFEHLRLTWRVRWIPNNAPLVLAQRSFFVGMLSHCNLISNIHSNTVSQILAHIKSYKNNNHLTFQTARHNIQHLRIAFLTHFHLENGWEAQRWWPALANVSWGNFTMPKVSLATLKGAGFHW